MERVWPADAGLRSQKRFPFYGIAGAAVILGSETLLFAGVEVVGVYFTPLVWSGYILLIDALNVFVHGSSLIGSRRREFLAMLPWSIACWLIFEAYNLSLKNWEYVGLPSNVPLRLLGYGWSFATIFPGILETADLFRGPKKPAAASLPGTQLVVSVLFGAACLAVPLVVPPDAAGKLFGLVWVGFFFLLDPLNFLLGTESIMSEWRGRRLSTTAALVLSGLTCGILWEFWNYWAVAKWHYAVPLPAGPKMFEMPLLGYLGFIPFAFECFVMQELLAGIVPSLRTARAG